MTLEVAEIMEELERHDYYTGDDQVKTSSQACSSASALAPTLRPLVSSGARDGHSAASHCLPRHCELKQGHRRLNACRPASCAP